MRCQIRVDKKFIMKETIIALLFLYSCSNETSQPEQASKQEIQALVSIPLPLAVKTVPKNNDGGWYYPNGKAKSVFKAGDTVVLKGDYSYINLDSVIGTASKPVVFIND